MAYELDPRLKRDFVALLEEHRAGVREDRADKVETTAQAIAELRVFPQKSLYPILPRISQHLRHNHEALRSIYDQAVLVSDHDLAFEAAYWLAHDNVVPWPLMMTPLNTSRFNRATPRMIDPLRMYGMFLMSEWYHDSYYPVVHVFRLWVDVFLRTEQQPYLDSEMGFWKKVLRVQPYAVKASGVPPNKTVLWDGVRWYYFDDRDQTVYMPDGWTPFENVNVAVSTKPSVTVPPDPDIVQREYRRLLRRKHAWAYVLLGAVALSVLAVWWRRR